MSNHIIDYFSSLFCRIARDEEITMATVGKFNRISNTQASSLTRRAPIEEVKKAVFGMKKFGSPRPDGISAPSIIIFGKKLGHH